MKALPIILIGVLCLQRQASATTIDFEGFNDGNIVLSQLSGLTFQNAIVLTAGLSLNEFEFPPVSGQNVLSDNDGPVTIDFADPISSFMARFTYLYNIGCVGLGCGGVRIEFYDASNMLQLVASSLFQSNAALSGQPGSSPNEILQSGLLNGFSITRVVIRGDPLGGSFALDDLSYTSTALPETSSIGLLLLGSVLILHLKRKMIATSKIAVIVLSTILMGGGTLWAQVTPTIREISVNPPAITVNTPASMLVSARIEGANLLPLSVTLVRSSSPSAAVFPMHDDGLNGDSIAADGTFSLRFNLVEAQALPITFQISAAFRGQLRRHFSSEISIPVQKRPLPDDKDFAVPSPHSISTSTIRGRYLSNEIVVFLKDNVTNPDVVIERIAASIGGRVVGRDSAFFLYQIRLTTASESAFEQALKTVREQPEVSDALENILGSPSLAPPTDPVGIWDEVNPSGKNWGFEFIKALSAWNITTGSDSTRMAVLDTCFETHEDLPAVTGLIDLRCIEPADHGNHVLGIIGARTNNGIGGAGMNWQGNFRVYTVSTMTELWKHAQAVALNRVRVANVSMGYVPAVCADGQVSNCYPDEASAIRRATFLRDKFRPLRPLLKDVLWVVAAGNDGRNAAADFPANLAGEWTENVITVGAIGFDGALTQTSNRGTVVQIAAPGKDIFSMVDRNAYGYKSGTSMAAPFVSGVAGLMLSVNSTMTAPELKNCLISSTLGVSAPRIPVLDALASVRCAGAQLANQPPTAGFLMSSTYGFSRNGQTLSLTVPTGGTHVVNLNASAPYSSDPDGTIFSYEWGISSIRGPIASLTGGTPTYSFGAGIYDLTLTVIDNRGARATATGRVSVSEAQPTPVLPTGPLTTSRMLHSAVELNNSELLVTGGFTVYPATVTGSAEALGLRGSRNTAGQLVVPRAQHTATKLLDGRVLIVGGNNAPQYTEIYNPTTDNFRLLDVSAGYFSSHTATLLPTGQVLVCGGVPVPTSRATIACSSFDPTTERWTPRASMPAEVVGHQATLLLDGSVLVTGGYDGFDRQSTTAAVSRYFPSTNTWQVMQPMLSARYTHTATLLQNGKVLISGGLLGSAVYSSSELYDPSAGASGMSAMTGSLMAGRREHTATPLNDGRVLIAGGHNNGGTTYRSIEIYNPAMGTFSASTPMTIARQQHVATLLRSGRVVVSGGHNGSTALASVETVF